jgi:WD40 repeat protein
VVLAPDGRTVAAVSAGGELGFWDAATGRLLAPLQSAHTGAADAAAFSRDGRWLVTAGEGNLLRSWDARRRAPVDTAAYRVIDLSFGPDSARVAVTLSDENFSGGLLILSVPGLEVIRTVRVPAGTVGRFSRDGRTFIYGDRQGRLWTLDARTWKPRGRPMPVSGPLAGADLSPDGRLLVTTSLDGTARLWNAASGRPIGGPLTDASGDILGAAFVGDGSRVVVAHTHGGYAWDVRPSTWERYACAVAGRALTHAEWEAALPERDYAPAC